MRDFDQIARDEAIRSVRTWFKDACPTVRELELARDVTVAVINALRLECEEMVYISEFYERTEGILLDQFTPKMVGSHGNQSVSEASGADN